MKLFHISDLHLGKRLYDYSLTDDQAYVLDEIIALADSQKPYGILIAGDIYDKPVPPVEAVSLFDSFLCRLSERGIKVFMISGNHDSPERIAFGGELIKNGGIYVSPVWNGTCVPITLTDEYGELNVYLLPFIKPSHARRFLKEPTVESYNEALQAVVDAMNVDKSKRNIIVTHQFITGASRSDSEEISVGGSDNVDASVFSIFDYTALGHIHSPQNVVKNRVRYSGTPLKYSFSEVYQDKSVTMVDIRQKGDVEVSTLPLKTLRDLRELRGTYADLTLRENYLHTNTEDYLHIILTDEDDIPDAAAKLGIIYPNLMKLDYDNKRTRNTESFVSDQTGVAPSPFEFFAELFEKQNGAPMDAKQSEYIENLIKKLTDGEA